MVMLQIIADHLAVTGGLGYSLIALHAMHDASALYMYKSVK